MQVLCFEFQNIKLALSLQYSKNTKLTGQMSFNKLKINQRSYNNLPNSVFEADFLWKVSLKILNSGLILKTFTHAAKVISTKSHQHFFVVGCQRGRHQTECYPGIFGIQLLYKVSFNSPHFPPILMTFAVCFLIFLCILEQLSPIYTFTILATIHHHLS